MVENQVDRIDKMIEINDLDVSDGSKSRRFKCNFKLLIKDILGNSNFEIVGWQTTRRTVSCYVRDKYTGRLMYLMVPDITVDSDAWLKNIQYKTVDNLYEIPKSANNYCSIDKIIPSLNALNVFYRGGVNLLSA